MPLPFLPKSKPQPKLTPEQLRQKQLAEQQTLIDKDVKRKIFIEQNKERIFQRIKEIALIIGLTVVFIIIALIVYHYLKPAPSQPLLNLNQVEQPPADFKITTQELKIIPSGNNVYDLLAIIRNSNTEWGVGQLNYTIILRDKEGSEVLNQKDSTYILPSEEKTLTAIGLRPIKETVKAELTLRPAQVQLFKDFVHPNIINRDVDHHIADGKSHVTGRLINQSPFSFSRVEVNVRLYNSQDQLIGLNYTNFNDFISDSARSFDVFWNEELTDVKKVIVEPYVDVFDSETFMNTYKGGQVLSY